MNLLEYFNSIVEWIGQHPLHAGWIIGLVAMAESLAIIGVIVPGVIIMVGAGTLIGSGVLDFWSIVPWAIAGAILGDALSYWLGHHFDYFSEKISWFKLHPDHLEKGKLFFNRYGDISVVIGRFFGPLRALVPMIAGMMQMPAKRFYLANIISAVVWAPVYLAPGMLIAQASESDSWSHYLIAAAAIGIALLVLIILRKRFD